MTAGTVTNKDGRYSTTLNISDNSFLDFAICCGTDYNLNMTKVGPQRAYQLIQKHKSIDSIPNVDTTCLNHVRVEKFLIRSMIFKQWIGITMKWSGVCCNDFVLRIISKEEKMREYFHQ